ncbi:helix-turn-helix domain-containing protein [Streptomyces sp. NPDC047017]|uniref:transcriptional regulator n=1 Tax=Streptomyces sp. NPDC047017 TaxID=3155024 RepID=UPI0033FAF636
MAGGEFAELLGELKERSGLSYGALGKRLHMSASTVHRYVSGDVVPTDYAPVERLARICRATPGELLELHRRWVRADALRGVRTETPAQAPEPRPEQEREPEARAEPEPEARTKARAEHSGQEEPADESGPRAPKRRVALLAGAGVVAVAAATALVVSLVPGHRDRTADERAAAATAAVSASPGGPPGEAATSATPGSSSPSRTASPSTDRPSASSPSATGTAHSDGASDAPPLAVATTPYYWDLPCYQSFLIDRKPQNVPPPPTLQDAVGWTSAIGAVAADHQMVVLTVQGTGAQTVVLRGLHVRVVSSGANLTWNKYAMGDGCGGGVDTKSFDVSLDLGNPLAQPVGGQRNFPYKVSESDPEVFYVNGHTSGHDVRWYLELDWSSGDRHGTVRVDDHGKPFRTSGSGPAYYASPLNGHGWELMNDS